MTLALKLATSLDGRIATAGGESRWITGPEARAEVHRLRAAHDVVMVGIGTALADDPELTVRTDPPPPRQPARCVLDSRLRLSPTSRLATTTAMSPVLVVTAPDAPAAEADALAARGVEIVRVRREACGVDLAAALAALAQRGLTNIFLEGGGTVAASALAGGHVDVLHWFRAPIVLGAQGVPAIGPLALARFADAPRFRRESVAQLGEDLWEVYRAG